MVTSSGTLDGSRRTVGTARAIRHCVELWALSATEWRVSDAGVPAGDAGSVLGFVEQTAPERFEVLRLGRGHGIERFTLGSLDEVTAFFRSQFES